MAKNQEPESVRLVVGEGDAAVTVSVAAEKAERLLATGSGYAKAPSRTAAKRSSKSDDDK
jgi:hypothetical protein